MKRKCLVGLSLAAASPVLIPVPVAAAPLVKGWAATQGGRGGAIVRVTNLNQDGPGSFKAAIEQRGPRIVVFEVGGVIDLGLTTLTISEPDLTIAVVASRYRRGALDRFYQAGVRSFVTEDIGLMGLIDTLVTINTHPQLFLVRMGA